MGGAQPRSTRQKQQQLAGDLRAQGQTWAEIAATFAQTYGVNMRTAFRLARGWSQNRAAEEWNKRWPAEPKTLKNLSYWEQWPSPSGHTPSLEVLSRLAELYQCHVADLIADCPDFRLADPRYQAREQLRLLGAAPAGTVARSIAASADVTLPEETSDTSSPTMTVGSPDYIDVITRRLQGMDIHELAGMIAAAWPDASGVGRRDLLLKLSAGLALAAASPGAAGAEAAEPARTPETETASLSGLWLSRYLFRSTGRGGEFEEQHYVVLRRQGNRICGKSLPHTTGSRLSVALSIDGAVASGTWTEQTSPKGYYKGATYHGTLQLLISPMGREMNGKWVGFGKNFKVNTGEWAFTWVDETLSARDLRQYHNKL